MNQLTLHPLEEGYVTDTAHGSSTERAYSVEARLNYHTPEVIGKQIFDNRWRKVRFDRAEVCVPAAPLFSHADKHELLMHSAAQALRWWLHAAADAEHKGYCLQTRLIEHSIGTTHNIIAKGFVSPYPPDKDAEPK